MTQLFNCFQMSNKKALKDNLFTNGLCNLHLIATKGYVRKEMEINF